MRESEAHTRGRVARSHVILFSAQQFWGPRSSLLQNCLYWTLHYNRRKLISYSSHIPKELTQYLEFWDNSWYMWFMKQLRRRLTKAFYLLLHSLQWNKIFQSLCVQSICRFFQIEFRWSYLSHNGISYGVQIHTAFVSQMKKHVGGLHSLWTWDSSNKNDFYCRKKTVRFQLVQQA